MSGYFSIGETKVRPGGYFNVKKTGDEPTAGVIDGVVAVMFKSTFGPLGKVVKIDPSDGYAGIFGTGLTSDAIAQAIAGGATTILGIRVGSGGTNGTVSLTAGESGTITVSTKYVGAMPFSVTVRNKLTDSTKKEVIFYTGTSVFEKVEFTADETDEVAACVAAINTTDSFTASSSATGVVTAVAQKAFTAGTNPTAVAADYSAALSEIEKYYFNTICCDSNDNAIHALISAFLERIYNAGQFGIGVVAEEHTVALATRETHAAAFNTEKMVYILNAYAEMASGTVDGYQLAAYAAGVIASTPSNQSITHMVLAGVNELNEALTNTQAIEAEQKGCIVLSVNADDQVWFDNAITTLVTPDADHDSGWKKIRRARTRFELLYRCNAVADSLVGQVDNDTNGRATIIGQLQNVGNQMIAEGKLNFMEVSESTKFISDADYCYFDIAVIDKDSAEKIYLLYTFQYSTNVEE